MAYLISPVVYYSDTDTTWEIHDGNWIYASIVKEQLMMFYDQVTMNSIHLQPTF